jgi:threonylcarbamoyladenosine tRNA methylthiotransferase MtaB
MSSPHQTVSFYTFGCKVNQYDTEQIRMQFKAAGWQEAQKHDEAEIYVVNTCTVTADSDRKARQLIRSLARKHPHSQLFVTGCYAESRPEEIKQLPNVAFIVPNKDKEQIRDLLNRYRRMPFDNRLVESHTIAEFTEHTRAFIKVQDGCDNNCAYCIVPHVRGKPRSRLLEEIVQETRILAEKGYQEIVLAGIRLGIYGMDKTGPSMESLVSLIQEIAKIAKVARIRLSSIEPMDINLSELIRLLEYELKLCHHLHIPMQSGDDTILSRMNRTYTIQDYQDLIYSIRVHIPDIAITTDIIVAFPGETDAQFQHTLEMVSKIGFAKVHVFRYSIRPGTVAEKMDGQIPTSTAKQRAQQLIQLADAVAMQYKKQLLNKIVMVLVEAKRDRKTGYLTGLTSQYQRVVFPGKDSCYNRFIAVKINQVKNNVLTGDEM